MREYESDGVASGLQVLSQPWSDSVFHTVSFWRFGEDDESNVFFLFFPLLWTVLRIEAVPRVFLPVRSKDDYVVFGVFFGDFAVGGSVYDVQDFLSELNSVRTVDKEFTVASAGKELGLGVFIPSESVPSSFTVNVEAVFCDMAELGFESVVVMGFATGDVDL